MEQEEASMLDQAVERPAAGGLEGRVVQIIALVKPFRAQAVLAALESVEILGGTVREAMGYGRQKDRLHQYLGSEYNSSFLPKVELTLFVEEEHAPGGDQGDRRPGPDGPDRRRQDPGTTLLRGIPELVEHVASRRSQLRARSAATISMRRIEPDHPAESRSLLDLPGRPGPAGAPCGGFRRGAGQNGRNSGTSEPGVGFQPRSRPSCHRGAGCLLRPWR